MEELTIITLCEALSNLTHNQCNLVENSNICRCIGDIIHPISPTIVFSTPPDIMLSEVCLIFFVLAIWLSAIGFCLNQYKSLRSLETQVHYCVNRKDPLNIGDIKIVAHEQDSIIYKKKRYSTLLDTHINPQDLKAMHYVQQYLPSKTIPSALSTLIVNRDDLSNNIPLSRTTRFNSSNNISLNTYHQTSIEMGFNQHNAKIPSMQRTGSARYSTGLTVPHISTSSSLYSPWYDPHMNEPSLTQHLCVPANSLGSNCYSTGNISYPVPQNNEKNSGEQLLDPRSIPATVRRSLLALHRENQENIDLLKKKDKTRSENDVRGALTSLKIKMKSKSKSTHTNNHRYRPHSNTLSISPLTTNNNDYDRRVLEYVTTQKENSSCDSRSINSVVRQSSKYSTQSTTESETTQDLPLITSIFISTEDDESSKKFIEMTEKTS